MTEDWTSQRLVPLYRTSHSQSLLTATMCTALSTYDHRGGIGAPIETLWHGSAWPPHDVRVGASTARISRYREMRDGTERCERPLAGLIMSATRPQQLGVSGRGSRALVPSLPRSFAMHNQPFSFIAY